ncbi:MAG: A/G-specific adenine glycosylase [Campylobacterales bacterium]|nr:A/G-specific adenine glycosylase [Campylobacterales bacterium]
MYSAIHDAIAAWYGAHGRRDLPWRTHRDPYRIWISEIMLQQTQVKTVLERFYFPFLEAFPALADLAAADLDDVLKRWEGLGYYTRARNLHRAAKLCVTSLPQEAAALEALPGIGRSTAHAIAAFAHDAPLPVLDANVKRVLSRFFAREERDERILWQDAYALLDTRRPYMYNQAMMDIGAMLCQSRNVTCNACPLQSGCQGQNDALRYGRAKAKKSVPSRHRALLVLWREGKLGLIRSEERFLHGLWGFMQSPLPLEGRALGSFVHRYTHFHLHATVYEPADAPDDERLVWFDRSEIATLSLSTADHKALALLDALSS